MHNHKILLYFFLLSLILAISCNEKSKKIDITSELNLLDSIQRKAHYTGDAVLLGSSIADTFYQVRSGQVTRSTKQQLIDRFTKYFREIGYSYWENIQPPMVILSDDNSMAAVTYNKKAISISKDEVEEDTTVFAWTAIMKRTKEGWKTQQIITTQ